MLFKPELAQAILGGRKTVIRRLRKGETVDGRWVDEPCRYKKGKDYAVQPGRGKKAIGRIRVVSVIAEALHQLDDEEIRLEGFDSRRDFEEAWKRITGQSSYLDPVWRIEFELVDRGGAPDG